MLESDTIRSLATLPEVTVVQVLQRVDHCIDSVTQQQQSTVINPTPAIPKISSFQDFLASDQTWSNSRTVGQLNKSGRDIKAWILCLQIAQNFAAFLYVFDVLSDFFCLCS